MRREFAHARRGRGADRGRHPDLARGAGDTVAVNQILVEIETAKAAVELPSPWAGTVGELLAQPGDTVAVGAPIIAIETAEAGAPTARSGHAGAGGGARGQDRRGRRRRPHRHPGRLRPAARFGDPPPPPRPDRPAAAPTACRPPPLRAPGAPPPPCPRTGVHPAVTGELVPLAKPPVRKLARDLGVDLHTVAGTGTGGVITREDVEAAAATPPATSYDAGATGPASETSRAASAGSAGSRSAGSARPPRRPWWPARSPRRT